MGHIRGVITVSNCLLSTLYNSSSGSAVGCLLMRIWSTLCAYPFRKRREVGNYTHGTLARVWACDPKSVHVLYNNDIIDSRKRFLEILNSGKTGFLVIVDVKQSRILKIVWQTSSGHSSNCMR